MSITKYEIFNKVVELGSLTKAGESLDLSQSAVSHAIANLEKELGFTLFSRSRSGIELTQNGRRVLQYIQAILQINDNMKQEVADINGLDVGRVKIVAFQAVVEKWLPGMVIKFLEQFPKIKIEVIEAKQNEIESIIYSGAADIGFVSLPVLQPLETISLVKNPLYAITQENDAIVGNTLEELSAKAFIIPKGKIANKINDYAKRKKIQLKPYIEIENMNAIIKLVQSKQVIGILPLIAITDQENLRKIELDSELSSSIGIATNSVKNLSPAAEKFLAISTLWLNENYKYA